MSYNLLKFFKSTPNPEFCARQAMVTSKAALEKGVWAASTLHTTNLTHLGFLLVQARTPLSPIPFSLSLLLSLSLSLSLAV